MQEGREGVVWTKMEDYIDALVAGGTCEATMSSADSTAGHDGVGAHFDAHDRFTYSLERLAR